MRSTRITSAVQLAFIRNCVKNGYAAFDGTTLALTPAGLIVQNSILAELSAWLRRRAKPKRGAQWRW